MAINSRAKRVKMLFLLLCPRSSKMLSKLSFKSECAYSRKFTDKLIKQRDKFIIIDFRYKGVAREDVPYMHELEECVGAINFLWSDGSRVISDKEVEEHGLVFIFAEDEQMCLFEGSFLSNGEPLDLILHGSKKIITRDSYKFCNIHHTFKNLEAAMQMMKAIMVYELQRDDHSLEIIDAMNETVCPEYVITLAKKLNIDTPTGHAWMQVNTGILNFLFRKKMEVYEREVLNLKKIVALCNVNIDKVKFFNCLDDDTYYGFGRNLCQMVRTLFVTNFERFKKITVTKGGLNMLGRIAEHFFRGEEFEHSGDPGVYSINVLKNMLLSHLNKATRKRKLEEATSDVDDQMLFSEAKMTLPMLYATSTEFNQVYIGYTCDVGKRLQSDFKPFFEEYFICAVPLNVPYKKAISTLCQKYDLAADEEKKLCERILRTDDIVSLLVEAAGKKMGRDLDIGEAFPLMSPTGSPPPPAGELDD